MEDACEKGGADWVDFVHQTRLKKERRYWYSPDEFDHKIVEAFVDLRARKPKNSNWQKDKLFCPFCEEVIKDKIQLNRHCVDTGCKETVAMIPRDFKPWPILKEMSIVKEATMRLRGSVLDPRTLELDEVRARYGVHCGGPSMEDLQVQGTPDAPRKRKLSDGAQKKERQKKEKAARSAREARAKSTQQTEPRPGRQTHTISTDTESESAQGLEGVTSPVDIDLPDQTRQQTHTNIATHAIGLGSKPKTQQSTEGPVCPGTLRLVDFGLFPPECPPIGDPDFFRYFYRVAQSGLLRTFIRQAEQNWLNSFEDEDDDDEVEEVMVSLTAQSVLCAV